MEERLARMPLPQSPIANTTRWRFGYHCIVHAARLLPDCWAKLSTSSETASAILFLLTLTTFARSILKTAASTSSAIVAVPSMSKISFHEVDVVTLCKFSRWILAGSKLKRSQNLILARYCRALCARGTITFPVFRVQCDNAGTFQGKPRQRAQKTRHHRD